MIRALLARWANRIETRVVGITLDRRDTRQLESWWDIEFRRGLLRNWKERARLARAPA